MDIYVLILPLLIGWILDKLLFVRNDVTVGQIGC